MAFRDFNLDEHKEMFKDRSRRIITSDYFELNPLYFKSSQDMLKFFPDLIDQNSTNNLNYEVFN